MISPRCLRAVAGWIVITLTAASLLAQGSPAARYWPQWRGPDANGISTTANPPVEWSETKNIRWKAALPGLGSASPVVWRDRVYVLTAVPVGVSGDAQHAFRGGVQPLDKYRFMVIALDRKTGRPVWERVAREQVPHEGARPENGTFASGSPVTDGSRVYAYFGSYGLYAYDMNGKPIWAKDLGDMRIRSQFGEGTTPVLHGNTLVIVWDHTDGSFIVALDKRNGRELWRVPRDEIDTWATPLVVEVDGRPQVIVGGDRRIRSYDLATGTGVWDADGLTPNAIPSPVYGDGMVFLTSGYRGNDLKAIRIREARGNLDGTGAIAWTFDRDTPYVPSPLLVDGILYFLKANSGILSAFDARSGKPHFQNQRLESVPSVYASPVSARGRIYIAGRDGTTAVIRSGSTFELLAKNTLEDGFDASPALVENEIFLRGHKYLYKIAEK